MNKTKLVFIFLSVSLSGCASFIERMTEPQMYTGKTYTHCRTYGSTTNCYERPIMRSMTPQERAEYRAIYGGPQQ